MVHVTAILAASLATIAAVQVDAASSTVERSATGSCTVNSRASIWRGTPCRGSPATIASPGDWLYWSGSSPKYYGGACNRVYCSVDGQKHAYMKLSNGRYSGWVNADAVTCNIAVDCFY